MTKKRWLNRTVVWLRVSWGMLIGLVLIFIGLRMQAWGWDSYAYIPGGTGVIILILDICAKFADTIDRRRS